MQGPQCQHVHGMFKGHRLGGGRGEVDGSNTRGLLSPTLRLAPRAHSVVSHRKQPHGTACREHVAKRLGTEDAKA